MDIHQKNVKHQEQERQWKQLQALRAHEQQMQQMKPMPDKMHGMRCCELKLLHFFANKFTFFSFFLEKAVSSSPFSVDPQTSQMQVPVNNNNNTNISNNDAANGNMPNR